MADRNVTSLVDFELNDDECLPITKCMCGAEFGHWKFMISVYRDHAYRCPKCGRGLYFELQITVYEVTDNTELEG